MTEDIERLIVEAETEEEEEDKSKQVEYRVSSETQNKKKSTRYFLKTSFKYWIFLLRVKKNSNGVPQERAKVLDQGEGPTCTIHAIVNAVCEHLDKKGVNISIKQCTLYFHKGT